MLNIKDIAEMAGVSKSTVSRYLNDGYVSEEKKKIIKKVIDKTGFVPLRHAKGMRSKKTNLIGVIVPKISTETTSIVLDGITNILSDKNYEVIIANTNLSIEKELEYLNMFKANQVDGIIFLATKISEKHIKILSKIKVPIVIVAQNVDNYNCVYYDDYNASVECVNYLINKGYKKIAFIGVYDEDIAVGYNRKKGYLDTLKENNMYINNDFIKIGNFSYNDGYKFAKELINLDNKPDSIFVVTDSLALGVIQCLNENNIKIPRDMAVISIGDLKISNFITPKLTTVHYFYYESGEESAKILLNLLENEIDIGCVQNIKLGYKLIERETV